MKRISLRSALRLSSMPVVVLLYSAAFNYAYVQWVAPTWESLGFAYSAPNKALVIVGYLLAATQCLIPPLRIKRPSQVLYWMLYFFVYVPGLFVPLCLQYVNNTDLLLLQLSLTLGMMLIALSYRMTIPAFRGWPLKPRTFWTIFGILFLLGNAFVLNAFRSMLHIASLTEIYSVRFQAIDLLEQYPAAGYVSNILDDILNPFLIVYGLFAHRKIMIVLGILGQILLYSTAALKISIISPLLIIIFYFTIKRDRGNWVPYVGLCFAGMIFMLTALPIEDVGRVVLDIILMRSFAMNGMLLGEYQYFFEHNPLTHWGNIHGFSLFISNPYTTPVAIEISRYFGIVSTFGEVYSNACFFAMDGIAGFGLPGIPLMGLLGAAVFMVMDSCAKRLPIEVTVACLTMYLVGLPNGSLFSMLLGQGLIIWLLLFLSIPSRIFQIGSKA